MDDKDRVRVCPFCEGCPPYLPGALQCVECGQIRPRRLYVVTWHSCVKGATEPAQDALDCEFHSAKAKAVRAIIDIECHFLGSYRIIGAQLVAAGTSATPLSVDGNDAIAAVIAALTSRGLTATR